MIAGTRRITEQLYCLQIFLSLSLFWCRQLPSVVCNVEVVKWRTQTTVFLSQCQAYMEHKTALLQWRTPDSHGYPLTIVSPPPLNYSLWSSRWHWSWTPVWSAPNSQGVCVLEAACSRCGMGWLPRGTGFSAENILMGLGPFLFKRNLTVSTRLTDR